MSDLVFMMGEFEARFPTDRQYCTNHMWAQQQRRRCTDSASRPTPCGCCRTSTSWNGASMRTACCSQRQTDRSDRKQEGRK